ncbi:FG-GAP-like repeat-containing protein [Nannocystis pusilla]|uniref:FG-GAP-like repeat-containing protein n=1 Tax=Nannocystis pusilla TaxID=889268 RepID=A0ABS7U3L5_9BACT|nr:FG-GAP-like repeat-containing protein [Nannocystis pusilla]MBZ5715139.1 FG-GAP-like repeat-containing protein [Nannocystis pusilla]
MVAPVGLGVWPGLALVLVIPACPADTAVTASDTDPSSSSAATTVDDSTSQAAATEPTSTTAPTTSIGPTTATTADTTGTTDIDPTATDPTATDPTATDPTATDATDTTDTTATDTTDTTATDTTTSTGGDPVCGNGVLEVGEACDAGADNGPGKACKADCEINVCGDGDLGPGEACDDGNLVDGDGCNDQCALPQCGDAKLDPGEECDDGKDGDNTDACTDACLLPVCGDAFVQAGEGCDLGPANSDNGACTSACQPAECGDGLVWSGMEDCDDANDVDDDACTNTCELPPEKDCGGAFQPGQYCFATPGAQLLASEPSQVIVEDFNGDGHLDIIAAEPNPKKIHVRLGDGAGGFDAGTGFSVPDNLPRGLTSADIDGDGDLDVLVRSNAGVTVLVNNGAGKFINGGPALAASAAPQALVAADIDGDGDPDFATADGTSHNVSVRWGAAGTTFSAAKTLRAGLEVSDIVAADLEGDGQIDLVALNKKSGNVSVFKNLGDRNFARQRTYRVPLDSTWMRVADIDGDDHLDLLVLDPAARSVYVRPGDGAGGFLDAPYHVRLGALPSSMELVDIDHDGNLDLLGVYWEFGKSFLLTATGDGAGQFSGVVLQQNASLADDVAAGDLDGDGRRDLVVTLPTSQTIEVRWSDANFDSDVCKGLCQAAVCGDGFVSPQVEDCDDGDDDDTNGCRNDCTRPPLTGCGNLVAEPGEVCFEAIDLPHSHGYTVYGYSLATGDLDNDGLSDLFVAFSDQVAGQIDFFGYGEAYETWLGTGEGGYQPAAKQRLLSSCTLDPRRAVMSDYTKDGKLDVMLTCYPKPGLANSQFRVLVYPGNGDGTLGVSSYNAAWNGVGDARFHDMDGDGDLDVVTVPSQGGDVTSVFVGFNRGVGVWGDLVAQGAPQHYPYQYIDYYNGGVRIGDLNNDGAPDVMMGSLPNFSLLGTGGGKLSNMAIPVPIQGASVLGDFTGDGVLDVAYVGVFTQNDPVYLYVGDGFGLFGEFAPSLKTNLGTVSGETFTEAADFDADGHLDLVFASQGTKWTTVRGDGSPAFKDYKNHGVALGAYSLEVREVTGDGRPDVWLGGQNKTALMRSRP